ncbi:zinc finger MYM-type protein 1-like [Penaeus monodon]|uniref:zinc finger MYM-type protein 1-like n=1 Tax=Penaeus monodon TaxID=6687 RepID=UPI0018A70377|nr:zinc finger MYM-type protein 1-like [Penaeus monodon]
MSYQHKSGAQKRRHLYKQLQVKGNSLIAKPVHFVFDVGTSPAAPTTQELEEMIRKGHLPHPEQFPNDITGRKFPTSALKFRQPIGEISFRRWLVFSPAKSALFCLPCRLFTSAMGHTTSQSVLASTNGWSTAQKWRKLFDRLPEQEHSTAHTKCYLAWRELERRLEESPGVDMLHDDRILSEAHKWKQILARIIHVLVFLGLIELLAHYDPVLCEHVTKIQVSQEKGERLQAHYLSASSQNEFIGLCAEYFRSRVLDEIDDAKYYSIIVDATPDSSHVEQTTFIVRYLTRELQKIFVQERFLTFVDCCKKTGLEIAMLILETLKQFGIPLADCRGQGYDNAANMSGKYNGAQQHILAENPLCLYSPCACHSLNLCGADSAACCKEVVTFFGMVQMVYNLFSSSPQRWSILQENIGSFLHGLSGTRWTDRVASVRPFAAQLPGIRSALEQLHTLNLTPKTTTEVNGAVKYISSFSCILMSTIWFKILVAIDQRNQIIQARQVNIDVEVSNLISLVNDLKDLRKGGIVEEEAAIKYDVFYVILDSVITGLSTWYDAAHKIDDLFGFLWRYLALTEQQISTACVTVAKQYNNDIFGDESLSINIASYRCFSRAIFQQIQDRQKLHTEHNDTRRLNDLTILGTESDLTRKVDFSNVINAFALKKARKRLTSNVPANFFPVYDNPLKMTYNLFLSFSYLHQFSSFANWFGIIHKLIHFLISLWIDSPSLDMVAFTVPAYSKVSFNFSTLPLEDYLLHIRYMWPQSLYLPYTLEAYS